MATLSLADLYPAGTVRPTGGTAPLQPAQGISGVKYNAPTGWVDEYGGNGELTGLSNWGSYFSGLDNLGEGYAVQDVQSNGGANPTGFTITRADPNGNKNVYQTRSLKLNPDGTVSWADGGDWTSHTQQSQMSHFLHAGLPMALAMAGGVAALGGAAGGAAGGLGAESLSGMDLAADAALGTGNNIITAGNALNTGAAGLSGMDLAADAAAGSGNSITTAGNALGTTPNMAATNPALIDSALQTPGYGASSAGAGGGAGSTLPSWLSSAGRQIGGRLLTTALLGGAAASGSGNINTSDRQGIANTLTQLGLEQAGIARDLYTDARDRITANDGMFSQILQNALTQQTQQAGRSDQLWDSYVANFLPNAEKFGQTALGYDTAGRRDEAAAAARAAVETESNMQREDQRRALARGGISLDSGRSLALDQQSRFNQTKLSTGAAADARRKVEETGLNLNALASNIGQGIVGTSQQQAGQSLTAGNAASNTMGTQASTRNAMLAPTQAFYGGATSATGSAGNVLNGVAATEAQNQANKNAGLAGLGNLAGTVLTAGKDSIIGQGLDWLSSLSDPKSKVVHGSVDGRKTLDDMEAAPVKEWTYKPGMGDGGSHVGRMAGEGDPTGPDGLKRIDITSELGKHQAAIVQIAKDVKQIKSRLSLADV